MRKIYSAVFLTLHLFLFSQGENNHWYFGNGAAINFNNLSTPQVLTNSNMYAGSRPVGSISDNNGKLLFYTNGDTVWNREHQPMTNGSLLSGTTNNNLQLAILKHPANSNWYYIFTPVPYFTNGASSSPGISNYSIIDMSGGPLDSYGQPLGEFLSNNSSKPFLSSGNSVPATNISVVQHANGISYWVIMPVGAKIYSYLVNNQGLINNPVISNMPFPSGNYDLVGNRSYMKISPILDNSYSFSNFIYVCYWGGGVQNYQKTRVMSFDNSTGMVTPDYVLDIDTNPLASSTAEFNKNGSILYLTNNAISNVYGVDMTSTSMPVASYLLPINSNNNALEGSDMQRNKYGDIYINYKNNNEYLAKIQNQNIFNNSTVNINGIYLNGRTAGNILPQLNQIYITPIVCQTDIVLNSSEINATYTHQAVNTIKTEINYSINSSQDIEMTAGESIIFLPDTSIQGKLFAYIQDCPSTLLKTGSRSKVKKNVKLSLELGHKNQTGRPSVFPNPTTEFLYIKSDSKITNVSVIDFSGRRLNVKLENSRIDVKNLSTGTYLINIETKDGISTEKFIKK